MKVLVIVDGQEAARTGEVEAVIEIFDHQNPDDVFAEWVRKKWPHTYRNSTTAQICEINAMCKIGETYAWNVMEVQK